MASKRIPVEDIITNEEAEIRRLPEAEMDEFRYEDVSALRRSGPSKQLSVLKHFPRDFMASTRSTKPTYRHVPPPVLSACQPTI